MSDFNNSLARSKRLEEERDRENMPQGKTQEKTTSRVQLPLKVLSVVKRWGPEGKKRGYYIPLPVHFAGHTVTVTLRLQAKEAGPTHAHAIWPQMADMEDQEVIVSLPEIEHELAVVEATEEK